MKSLNCEALSGQQQRPSSLLTVQFRCLHAKGVETRVRLIKVYGHASILESNLTEYRTLIVPTNWAGCGLSILETTLTDYRTLIVPTNWTSCSLSLLENNLTGYGKLIEQC